MKLDLDQNDLNFLKLFHNAVKSLVIFKAEEEVSQKTGIPVDELYSSVDYGTPDSFVDTEIVVEVSTGINDGRKVKEWVRIDLADFMGEVVKVSLAHKARWDSR